MSAIAQKSMTMQTASRSAVRPCETLRSLNKTCIPMLFRAPFVRCLTELRFSPDAAAVRPLAVRPVAVRRSVVVHASADRSAALQAAVVTTVATVLSTPLVAEATTLTPSLSNFLSSLVAGAVVLGGIAAAVTLVSRFDTISRD
eukprot:gene13193-19026_t